MMKKLYDATVVVGEYEKNGEVKKKYLTIGTVFQGDKGMSMKMNKSFNPAGCPDKDGSGEIWVNFYEPKEKPVHCDEVYKPTSSTKAQHSGKNPIDDIPFAPFIW